MTPGQRIRAARQKRGLSQQKLANLLGVSAQAVSQWEVGKNHISFANANQVANILGVDVMWIMEENEQDETIRLSPSSMAHGNRAPIIDITESMLYYIYNVQREEQFDPNRTTLEVTLGSQGQCFAIIIDDTSMSPEFHVGDVAIFDNAVHPESGDYVVCFVYGSASEPPSIIFRRYWFYKEAIFASAHVKLDALNQTFPTIYLNNSLNIDSGSFGHVIATMVEHRRLLKGERRLRISPKK